MIIDCGNDDYFLKGNKLTLFEGMVSVQTIRNKARFRLPRCRFSH